MNNHHQRSLTRPLQSDLMLVQFDTYEEYLDSIYTELDMCYFTSKDICRKIAEFGYRRDGPTWSEAEFNTKRNKVLELLAPKNPNMSYSGGLQLEDAAQIALAIRERPNKVGLLATIIFVNCINKQGKEVSGYIDYTHSLFIKDWTSFFKDSVPIIPDRFDLGFYDWKAGRAVSNNSMNFKTVMSSEHGLLFQHKFDRTLIFPDPNAPKAGRQTTRSRIKTKLYNTFVLIDHSLRFRK